MARGLQAADVAFVERLAVAASLHDPGGHFVYLNSAGERASGRTSEQLRGRHFTYLIPEEARDHVVALFSRAVQGETTEFETVFYDAEGGLHGVRATHLPLVDDEDVIGVLILAFDVRVVVPETVSPDPAPTLTPRQLEVLELVAAGISTPDIAAELSLSIETVRNHLRHVLRELRAHTRVEAVASARRLGLLSPHAFRPMTED